MIYSNKKTEKRPANVRGKASKQKNNARVLFWISVSLIVLASAPLFLIPRAGQEILQGEKSTAVAIATVFWGLEIGAYAIQVLIAQIRKRAKTAPAQKHRKPTDGKFKLESIVVFGVAALALVGLVVPMALGVQSGVLVILSAAVLLAAGQIGFLFGSRNYIFINL